MIHEIVICDDDRRQADMLNTMISRATIMSDDESEKFGNISVFNSYTDTIKYVGDFKIIGGIYFFDIELEDGKNGLDLAEEIRSLDAEAVFVFITSHEGMAAETYVRRIEALDFILKSVDKEYMQKRITETASLALKKFKLRGKVSENTFVYRMGKRKIIENIDNTLCIVTANTPHKLKLVTVSGISEFTGTIAECESKYAFLSKISQSCLVNPQKIKSVDSKKKTITLTSGKEERVSRSYWTKIENLVDR